MIIKYFDGDQLVYKAKTPLQTDSSTYHGCVKEITINGVDIYVPTLNN